MTCDIRKIYIAQHCIIGYKNDWGDDQLLGHELLWKIENLYSNTDINVLAM